MKSCNILAGKAERKGDQGVDRIIILKWIFKEVGCKDVDKIYSA
jgi:hypothetical protein